MSQHIYTDESGVIQLSQKRRGPGRPRKYCRPVWDETLQKWTVDLPAPANAGLERQEQSTADETEPDTVLSQTTHDRHLLEKIEADRTRWEATQRRRYGVVYKTEPDPNHPAGRKLVDGPEAITMAPEYAELLERSMENGDLIECEDGSYGWKNPSPHDPAVRAEDWPEPKL
jgi:hypothetical protein